MSIEKLKKLPLDECMPDQRKPLSAVDEGYAPVLASTLLCLELLRAASAPDLRAVVRLIKRDPGAVLRLYALRAQEFAGAASSPERFEDCLAAIDLHSLAQALSHPASLPEEQLRLLRFARHASDIASYTEVVAASLALPAQQAYVVGLLHALGTLPAELGRTRPLFSPNERAARAAACAHLHGLPKVFCQALDEIHRDEPTSLWAAAVHAAHDLAGNTHRRGSLR